MDALLARCAILAAAVACLGASYRTPNFVVEAPTGQMAEQIGRAAETFRRDLAIDWTGKEMPNWSRPCMLTAKVDDHLGAGGATSFEFQNGEVFGWTMTIQGSLVRILDSVLPHEVTHTVFATHFRQPLPRWADEGACTTVEHASERAKQQDMLISFLRTGRGIAFSRMFAMREYPRDVMPLYSQGYSLARFLVAQGGKRKFLNYISDGLRDENWSRATKQNYGFDNLHTLQEGWLAWVKQGSPTLKSGSEAAPLVAVKSPDNAPRPGSLDDNGPAPGPSADALASNVGASVYDVASNPAALDSAPAGDEDATWRPRGTQPSDLADRGPPADSAPPDPNGQEHQVTRPQDFQRAQQVILEWSRPPGGSASAMAARPLPEPR